MTPRRLILFGAGAAVAGAAVAWKASRRVGAVRPDAGRPRGAATLVDERDALPEFVLHGPAGTLTRASLAGRWTMLFFGYTGCADVCPTTLAALAEVNRRLAGPARPAVLFVSVDPSRDSDALLAQYVPAFDPGFVGASGSDEALAALAGHLGVVYRRNPPSAGGGYTVDHTASIFLIDPQPRLKAVFPPPHDVDAIAADLERLIG